MEHIEDPLKVLAKVKTLLKEDGLLLITLPNINSIGRFIFQENWEWVLPWHLHFYNPKTLNFLIEQAGFEKIKIYQMPSPLWYQESLQKLLGKKIYFHVLYLKLLEF